MEAYFEEAWILLGVGMLTVFAVLFLVVLVGNSIILFVNRFFPGDEKENRKNINKSGMSSSQLAAIVATVSHVTGGRGTIVDIRKKQ
ncbi:OadG family protein [Thermophagus sp. OGC60D27]|uniref:OadG family protein n=1 Tax=Thermophagus sp. OGC60D27 TaxID=3458415 RepID=UPI0040380D47